jgi:hypothetical protein
MARSEKITNLKCELKQSYNLTQDEADTLANFKASDCKELNAKIRRNNLDSTEKLFCKNLSAALLKIPSTTENNIYRHLNFTEGQLEMVKKFFQTHLGKKIKFLEFQSCTLRECFTGNHDDYNWSIKITINQPTNAKDIYSLWNKHELGDAEEEILMLNETCFEVISVDVEAIIKVNLKEVPYDMQTKPVPEF